MPPWLIPVLTGVAGLLMGRSGGESRAASALDQDWVDAMRRLSALTLAQQEAQRPLFDALNRMAFEMLPRFSREGLPPLPRISPSAPWTPPTPSPSPWRGPDVAPYSSPLPNPWASAWPEEEPPLF